MHRMSPLDASFLHIEGDNNPMHIGSTAIFEGPAPAYEDLKAAIAGKLPLVPRYRQVPRFVPLDLGRPLWQDDPHFTLDYHLRHTALPRPGGVEQLRRLIGRVMAQRLDRTKPLWELWMVEGLEDGHWALLSKTHHAMVDGVSGTDLLSTIFDRSPEPAPPVPDYWKAEPAPSDARIVAEAVADRVVSPYEAARTARAAVTRPRRLVVDAAEVVRGSAAFARLIRPAAATEMNGPLGPHRSYAWARASLADVKKVRAAFGGTVNDVVLAVVTRGFRELLTAHGEDVAGRFVRTLVPVSVRRPTETGGVYNNRVSGMFAELPVCLEDPRERLDAIRTQMTGLKESKQAVAGEVLTSLSGFAPPLLLSLGSRVAMRVPQRNVQTVTTNVPGPQFPLYVRGRRMIESFPYVCLAGRIRVGVAIFSYLGGLTFGVTGDADSFPDVDVVCRGVEAGMAELVKLAEQG
jgi:diacylglycerol O-acyltransferase